jgi:hypothetical protein
VASAVYVERVTGGIAEVAPATRLSPGDRVIAILRWDAPRDGNFTVVSAVPARLALQSASRDDIEVSTDGGRSWRRLGNPRAIPAGATHLRWPGDGGGLLSYRAVVR